MKDRIDSNHQKVLLSPIENLAVGCIGGALETTLQMPIITYKFCVQEGRSLPISPLSWYRGVTVQMGTVAPITSFQFLMNGFFQNFMAKVRGYNGLSDGDKILSAAGAGAASALLYTPADMITIHQQKLSLPASLTAQYIVDRYGTVRLFRGFCSCALREGIYTAGYLGLAPVFANHLLRSEQFSGNAMAAGVTGACMAGTLAALLSHPVDTSKTILQADIQGDKFQSARHALYNLLREKGVKNMFQRGLGARTMRFFGAFFVCMTLKDFAEEKKADGVLWPTLEDSTTLQMNIIERRI